jgi:hypothetical protein
VVESRVVGTLLNSAVGSERHNSDDSSCSSTSAGPLVTDASGVAKTSKWKVSRDALLEHEAALEQIVRSNLSSSFT